MYFIFIYNILIQKIIPIPRSFVKCGLLDPKDYGQVEKNRHSGDTRCPLTSPVSYQIIVALLCIKIFSSKNNVFKGRDEGLTLKGSGGFFFCCKHTCAVTNYIMFGNLCLAKFILRR